MKRLSADSVCRPDACHIGVSGYQVIVRRESDIQGRGPRYSGNNRHPVKLEVIDFEIATPFDLNPNGETKEIRTRTGSNIRCLDRNANCLPSICRLWSEMIQRTRRSKTDTSHWGKPIQDDRSSWYLPSGMTEYVSFQPGI